MPVFDPSNIGQLSKLNSFAYTMKFQMLQTGGSGERDNESTVTVITNPWQAQIILHQMDNTAKEDYARNSTYTWNWVGDLIYTNPTDDSWRISPQTKDFRYVENPFLTSLPWGLKTARFAGHEHYLGFPANHFVFNIDDFQPPIDAKYHLKSLEGNLWLSQDGNYLLHVDYKASGDFWQDNSEDTSEPPTYSPGSMTLIYDLSSVDQVKEIPAHPDLPTQVDLEPGVPVPPKAELSFIKLDKGSPSMRYYYDVNLSYNEILAFYAGMPPINGWTVKPKSTRKDPAGNSAFVTLTKDGHDLLLQASYIDSAGRYQINFSYPP